MFWSECGTFEGTRPHHRKDIMDFRFLLVLLLPALTMAGTYSDGPMTFGTGYEGNPYRYDDSQDSSYKGKGDDMDNNMLGAMSADVLNEESAYAEAAAEDYSMKGKTIEQSAKWFRNLANEKQLILSQVKKRANLLRAMAAESLQNAEQYRKSAAQKSESSKVLESKAQEAESLNKEQAILVNELRAKMNNELKLYLDRIVDKAVAEVNAEASLAEVGRQKTAGAFLEGLAEDMISEAVKWERSSMESEDRAKKLKAEAAAESAKAKEFEKNRKEAEDAAREGDRKVHEFYYFKIEFHLKSYAEGLKSALARIKAKYLHLIAASQMESASYLRMFGHMEDKDKTLWEKRTASARGEAKLYETSAKNMFQNIEKLKSSMKKPPSKTNEKVVELVAPKAKPVPEPKLQEKAVEVPIAKVPEKKV